MSCPRCACNPFIDEDRPRPARGAPATQAPARATRISLGMGWSGCNDGEAARHRNKKKNLHKYFSSGLLQPTKPVKKIRAGGWFKTTRVAKASVNIHFLVDPCSSCPTAILVVAVSLLCKPPPPLFFASHPAQLGASSPPPGGPRDLSALHGHITLRWLRCQRRCRPAQANAG